MGMLAHALVPVLSKKKQEDQEFKAILALREATLGVVGIHLKFKDKF